MAIEFRKRQITILRVMTAFGALLFIPMLVIVVMTFLFMKLGTNFFPVTWVGQSGIKGIIGFVFLMAPIVAITLLVVREIIGNWKGAIWMVIGFAILCTVLGAPIWRDYMTQSLQGAPSEHQLDDLQEEMDKDSKGIRKFEIR